MESHFRAMHFYCFNSVNNYGFTVAFFVMLNFGCRLKLWKHEGVLILSKMMNYKDYQYVEIISKFQYAYMVIVIITEYDMCPL